MNSNVNLDSVMGALGFLGSCLVLLVLALFAAHALWARKFWRARAAALAAAALVLIYAALLLGFSLASGERVLAAGEEKYFCELDCHLAYSVASVRRTKTLGGGADRVTAGGEFYVVTLRTRFDENTITPTRGDVPLTPNPRRVTVHDADGRAYEISDEGQRALASEGGPGRPLSTPLRPGEAYTTGLVFDLPEGARDPVLLLNEEMLATRFIVGHENSPMHKKTKFRLAPPA